MGLLRRGRKNPPNSIMEHTLYVNIFLEAYGNPSTAEALSLELGVALPYMEDELAISDFYVSRGYILVEALRRGYLLSAEKVSQAVSTYIDLV